jgi:SMC interacting uncharacterized protein involved in chromosome segregation
MSDVVRSVFRQRKVEKLYELVVPYNDRYEIIFHAQYETIGQTANFDNVIEDVEIGRYDIEIPLLEVGDKFFLHDISKVVEIKSRMHSSDGSIIYYVKDELVETENTKKSYDECREKIENWKCSKEEFEVLIKHRDTLEEELNNIKRDFDEYKKKYKYEHKFFNLN